MQDLTLVELCAQRKQRANNSAQGKGLILTPHPHLLLHQSIDHDQEKIFSSQKPTPLQPIAAEPLRLNHQQKITHHLIQEQGEPCWQKSPDIEFINLFIRYHKAKSKVEVHSLWELLFRFPSICSVGHILGLILQCDLWNESGHYLRGMSLAAGQLP